MKYTLLGSIVLSSLLYAQNSVYDLGRIEVIEADDISQNKTSVKVEKETIKETESITAVEALQNIAGISVQKVGKKNLTDIRLRGFENKRIPIFVDGIPVYVPYNRETDLGRYTTYDLSEITVSKGYVSPMFGPNTLGGAVNLVTRKPQKELEGEIGAGVFSGNGHHEFVTLGTNQESYYGLLSVSNYQRDYFNLSDDFEAAGMEDGGRRENSDSKDFKLNIKVGYTPNDTDEYSLNYIVQRAEKGNPFYASDYNGGDEGSRRGWRTRKWRWPDWDKTSYYFISKTNFDALTLKTRLFYDEFYNKLVDQKWGWASEYDDHSIGASTELDYKINDKQMLKLALFQKNDYHKDISSDNPGLDIDIEGKTQSIGLEYSWKISDKYKWVVGLSYDKNSIDKAEYRDAGAIKKWDNYDTDSLSPQTVLYYNYSKDTTFYGAIGRRSNLPSLNDRYATKAFGYEANPNLEAEIATNYELGVEHKIGYDHMIKSAIFLTQTEDYIDRVTLSNGNDQYQNIGEEEHVGFEFSLDSFWSDNLSTNIAYTYVDSELKKSTDSTIKYITAIPDHTLSIRAKYNPVKALAIIPSLRFESERYVDNTAKNPTTRDFIVMDIKSTYHFNKSFEVSAGIKNVFDKYYYYTEGHPTAGRNYYATFRYLF